MDNSADRDLREKNVTNPGQSKSADSGSWQKKDSTDDNEKRRTFTEPDNPSSRQGNDISKQQTGGPGKPTA